MLLAHVLVKVVRSSGKSTLSGNCDGSMFFSVPPVQSVGRGVRLWPSFPFEHQDKFVHAKILPILLGRVFFI